MAVAPPFTALHAVAEASRGAGIFLAAQNVCDREEGAFTGEVSARMLADVGCRYVIVGHSERRAIFGEDDGLINRKLRSALNSGLQPILCIGETLVERETDRTFAVVERQLQEGLKDVSAEAGAGLVLAYEPVWAIGTGKTASPGQAAAVHGFIREFLGRKYGLDYSRSRRVLYGGSVNPANIVSIMAQDDINGVLVGGASLEVETFSRLLEF